MIQLKSRLMRSHESGLHINQIYNEDCLLTMQRIPDNFIDLVVTDPPYKIIGGGCTIIDKGNEPSGILNRRREKHTDWVDEVRSGKMFKENDIKFCEWLPQVYRVLKEGTHFYVMINDRNMGEMLNESQKCGFKLVNILAWKKNNCTPNKFYMKNVEFILLFRKGSARNINNMGSKQCIEVNNIIGHKNHPTEKPVELMRILVENSSNEGDIVLDPFMGTASTILSCIETNRRYVGIELDPVHFEKAKAGVENCLSERGML